MSFAVGWVYLIAGTLATMVVGVLWYSPLLLAGPWMRALDEWHAAIPREIAGDKKKVVSWLKNEHGVGHFQAVKIFECSQGKSEYDDRAGIEAKLFGTPGDALAAALDLSCCRATCDRTTRFWDRCLQCVPKNRNVVHI